MNPQETNININVTVQELELIANALSELPYKVSKQVIDKLTIQYNMFVQEQMPPPPTKPVGVPDA